MTGKRFTKLSAVLGVLAAAGLGTAGCGSSSSGSTSASGSGAAAGKTLKIAFFASASANGFADAVWTSMQTEAKRLGNVQLTELDGNFNATTQFSQAQTAASAKQYNGAVVMANDTVGMAPAVKTLVKSGTVVANVLNPLGPSLRQIAPQVPGVISVVADPAYETTLQAQQVVAACANKNPCRVVVFIGGLQYPFDKIRDQAYRDVFKSHPNIQIVATGQGNYDRNTSLTVMSNILQAHPKFDVLLSAAEQSTVASQIALTKAGWNVPQMVKSGALVINSLGATKQGVAAVRAGDWNLTVGNFPGTAGSIALDQVVRKLRGQSYQTAINLDKVAPVPLVLTKQVLSAHPSFTGQWSG